jgi:uncharacterized protein with von Willebrand factor type A (vWA) domain
MPAPENISTGQKAPIAARVTGFVDHLRANDFKVGPAETQAALQMIDRIGRLDLRRTRQSLKTLLSGRHEEWQRFDELFEAYWFARGRERAVQSFGNAPNRSHNKRPSIWSDHLEGDEEGTAADQGIRPGSESESGRGSVGRIVASAQTNLQKSDLRHVADPQEIAEAERLAYRLAVAMRYRLSRRYKAARSGSKLDLRRTIRRNIHHGGEPLNLVHRARPDRPVRIVVLLDVSGSMKLYSRFFLQFVKGLVSEWIDTDAYLFHTRLVRVTDVLREKDAMKAMSRLALMADGFGGGTRLGESLKTFNDRYAKRALNSRTVLMILSDGYDTGSPEVMAGELKRLKKRVRRIVWLNPVLGWRDYEPITKAMALALPLIDHFCAANTLESLAAIENDIARM